MKRFVYIFLVLMLGAPLYGQNDTSRVEKKTSSKGWNAMNYSLQKRYTPQGDDFVSKKFTDNTFISLTGGGMRFIGSSDVVGAAGKNFGVGVGKWFNKYHSLRVDLLGDGLYRGQNTQASYMLELMAMYQFNISSYLGGYSRTRFVEFYTLGGLSTFLSKYDTHWGGGVGAHIGLDVVVRLDKRFDLFLEPLFSVYLPSADPSLSVQTHKYDLSYRYNMGFRYNFRQTPKAPKVHWLDKEVNGFMFYGGGAQTQFSDLAMNEVGFFRSMGPDAFVGVGSWIKDYFAIRASIFYANHTWGEYLDFGKMAAHYSGGRIEMEFEPLYPIFKKSIDQRRFTLSVILGPEFGYMKRCDVREDYGTLYLGLTAALQPQVKLTKNMAVFLQPRLSIVPYAVDDISLGDIMARYRYYDAIMNLNIGFTYSL